MAVSHCILKKEMCICSTRVPLVQTAQLKPSVLSPMDHSEKSVGTAQGLLQFENQNH